MAVGNIISLLTDNFPDTEISDNFDNTITSIKDRFLGKESSFSLLSFNVTKIDAISILKLFQNDTLSLDFLSVEEFRLDHNLRVFPPERHENIFYNTVNGIHDIIYTLFYCYALKGLKLRKCEHCGKWFAVKSLKTKFCPRYSPMKKYSHLSCYEAQKNCRRDCLRIKNRIETKIRQHYMNDLTINSDPKAVLEFQNKCEPYYLKAKVSPSANNLECYISFLSMTEKTKSWREV